MKEAFFKLTKHEAGLLLAVIGIFMDMSKSGTVGLKDSKDNAVLSDIGDRIMNEIHVQGWCINPECEFKDHKRKAN